MSDLHLYQKLCGHLWLFSSHPNPAVKKKKRKKKSQSKYFLLYLTESTEYSVTLLYLPLDASAMLEIAFLAKREILCRDHGRSSETQHEMLLSNICWQFLCHSSRSSGATAFCWVRIHAADHILFLCHWDHLNREFLLIYSWISETKWACASTHTDTLLAHASQISSKFWNSEKYLLAINTGVIMSPH